MKNILAAAFIILCFAFVADDPTITFNNTTGTASLIGGGHKNASKYEDETYSCKFPLTNTGNTTLKIRKIVQTGWNPAPKDAAAKYSSVAICTFSNIPAGGKGNISIIVNSDYLNWLKTQNTKAYSLTFSVESNNASGPVTLTVTN